MTLCPVCDCEWPITETRNGNWYREADTCGCGLPRPSPELEDVYEHFGALARAREAHQAKQKEPARG